MMNLPAAAAKGITSPFLPGSFSIESCKLESALKILSRSGLEENLAAAHKMGFNSNMRNSLRMVELGNAVYNFTAIMLISTLTNLGSADTCTVSLAGNPGWRSESLFSKYLPYTSLTAPN